LRRPELFLDDEEDDREELDRFFEVPERLRDDADDRDDLDFLVAGIFVPSLRKCSPFLRCSLLTSFSVRRESNSERLAEFATGKAPRSPVLT
jgi:hypothetical protein